MLRYIISYQQTNTSKTHYNEYGDIESAMRDYILMVAKCYSYVYLSKVIKFSKNLDK